RALRISLGRVCQRSMIVRLEDRGERQRAGLVYVDFSPRSHAQALLALVQDTVLITLHDASLRFRVDLFLNTLRAPTGIDLDAEGFGLGAQMGQLVALFLDVRFVLEGRRRIGPAFGKRLLDLA